MSDETTFQRLRPLQPLPPHPAKFTDDILEKIGPHLKAGWRILDPFGGTGKVHKLTSTDSPNFAGLDDCLTVSNDIEIEWAIQGELYQPGHNIVSDALRLPFRPNSFDAVVTSPTYGNRMADHHNAQDDSKRHTYTHYLGKPLHKGNSGVMQWGAEYRAFHERAWAECWRVLRPGGMMFVNVKDHIRKGEVVNVVSWHERALSDVGFWRKDLIDVRVPGLKHGANHDVRVDAEWIIKVQRPPVVGFTGEGN